jgi:hypothetical protein
MSSSAKRARGDSESNEGQEEVNDKQRFVGTRTFDPKVKLDVGGHKFTTSAATLTSCSDSMLAAMFSGRYALPKDENGTYFIDRDGTHFREILNFLRAPGAYRTDAMPERVRVEVEVEADFFGLKDLMFPPFVPAASVEVMTHEAGYVTVSQDDAGLWYMEDVCLNCARCLVIVCDSCGWGQPVDHPGKDWSIAGIPLFTTGRKITDAQPRKAGAFNWNGDCCYCDFRN